MTSERANASAVFVLALALRLLHLQQVVANDPFYTQPSVDSLVYRDWALRIASGDWLGSEVFFLSPLYGYLLALVYAIAGPSHFWPLALNAALGAGACALVYLLASRLFDRRVAIVSAALAATYRMEIFYEGAALLEALQTFLTAGIALAAVRALDAPTWGRFAATGVLLGLSTLARQNALLFAPLFAVWTLFALREIVPIRRSVTLIGVFLLGLALAIAPATLRNAHVGGEFVLANSTGGLLLYDAWNPSASPTYSIPAIFPSALADDPIERITAYRLLAEQQLGRSPLRASEVSSYWRDEALRSVWQYPGHSLALALEKARLFWNALEPWDVRSFTVSRRISWVLGLPLATWGLIAPLALAGLLLSAKRWRRLVPVYLLLLVYFASAVLFVVLSRYRVPAVPLLAIFAGSSVVALWDFARARDWRRLALATALVAVAAFAVHWRVPGENLAMAHYNLGNAYKELGRFDPAVEEYFEALALDPNYLSTWNNLALIYERSGEERDLVVRTWQRLLALAQAQGSALHVERAERHLRDLGQ